MAKKVFHEVVCANNTGIPQELQRQVSVVKHPGVTGHKKRVVGVATILSSKELEPDPNSCTGSTRSERTARRDGWREEEYGWTCPECLKQEDELPVTIGLPIAFVV